MTLVTRQVSVTTGSAIEITSGTPANAGGKYDINMLNTDGSNPVFLGPDNTVTSGNGHKLPAGAAISFRLEGKTERVWARATGGTVIVTAIESVVA